jgi:Protein of unknown function (DUF1566)
MVARFMFTLLAGAAFLAIPAIANAHAGDSDPHAVHACVGNVSKIVRIVGVSGACLESESPAHWQIQGPPGAPGVNGTNGTSGTNGTNGTNGTDGTSVTFVDYFSGSVGGCSNGGAIYAAGNPPVNAYVCNGKDGKDGTNATRADGPCFDTPIPTFHRYIDCANGTVTDTVTGLIWLKNWDCLPQDTWAAGNQVAASLKNGDCLLTDNSSPGDWRLPTKDEWDATVARANALGCALGTPHLTNDVGKGCYDTGVGSSFVGVAPDRYWSSSVNETEPGGAAYVSLDSGEVADGSHEGRSRIHRAWPVRGGRR